MAKRKKLTPNQREYRKQITRLNRAIRRIEKAGYVFQEDISFEMPKRVTKKAIERLKSIKPKDLYQFTVRLNPETGEIIPGQEARIESARERARKAAETRRNNRENAMTFGQYQDTIIQNFKNYILGFPRSISERLISWINALIQQAGTEAVVTMLTNSPDVFREYLIRVSYDSETAVTEYAASMMEYLPDLSDQRKSDLMDQFEAEELGYDI